MSRLARSSPVRRLRTWVLRRAMRGGDGDASALLHRLPAPAQDLLRRDGLDPVPALTDGPAVRRLPLPLGLPGWVVTGYDEAKAVLADTSSYSNDFGHLVGQAGIAAEQDPGGLGMIDPPRHTRLRRTLAAEFTSARLRALRPEIEAVVAEQLDAVAAAPDPVDLWRAWALAVPARVIGALLGLAPAERDALVDLSARRFDVVHGTGGALSAVGDSLALLRTVVTQQRHTPGPGLLGRLVQSDLTDAEITGLADGLVTGGLETTASTLALGVVMLAADPDAATALRAGEDPDPFVTTVLRRVSAVQVAFPRFVRTPVELAGHRLAVGDVVLCSLVAANRDPAHLDDPHVAFGYGAHRCLGAELARLELAVALPALVCRFPGLRLAVPAADLPYRALSVVYGIDALPVHLSPP